MRTKCCISLEIFFTYFAICFLDTGSEGLQIKWKLFKPKLLSQVLGTASQFRNQNVFTSNTSTTLLNYETLNPFLKIRS